MNSIHHFACSGGTIISKCLAAMPNTLLLSELDPLSPLSPLQKKYEIPEFSPSDPIRLLKHNIHEVSDDILISMFLASLSELSNYCHRYNLNLIIRDHTHSCYCTGTDVPSRLNMLEILQQAHKTNCVVTVRNPIESYLSLYNNGWLHFEPSFFDEYCRRLTKFINDFEGQKLVKYEDFCQDPDLVLQDICSYMAIEYSQDYTDFLPLIKLTGDSGRSSSRVSVRTPKTIPNWLQKQASESEYYVNVCETLEYETIT